MNRCDYLDPALVWTRCERHRLRRHASVIGYEFRPDPRASIYAPKSEDDAMTIPNCNLNYPTAIKFGAGRVKELAELCKATGIKRPLFVTDPASRPRRWWRIFSAT